MFVAYDFYSISVTLKNVHAIFPKASKKNNTAKEKKRNFLMCSGTRSRRHKNQEGFEKRPLSVSLPRPPNSEDEVPLVTLSGVVGGERGRERECFSLLFLPLPFSRALPSPPFPTRTLPPLA